MNIYIPNLGMLLRIILWNFRILGKFRPQMFQFYQYFTIGNLNNNNYNNEMIIIIKFKYMNIKLVLYCECYFTGILELQREQFVSSRGVYHFSGKNSILPRGGRKVFIFEI